jgi:hypothetical protein
MWVMYFGFRSDGLAGNSVERRGAQRFSEGVLQPGMSEIEGLVEFTGGYSHVGCYSSI